MQAYGTSGAKYGARALKSGTARQTWDQSGQASAAELLDRAPQAGVKSFQQLRGCQKESGAAQPSALRDRLSVLEALIAGSRSATTHRFSGFQGRIRRWQA
jgi:hypothetical protein